MNKHLKQILILACLIAILTLPYFVFAQESGALKTLTTVATDGGYSGTNEFSLAQILGTVVKTFIGLLGVVFIGLIIYAGYNWMIARGEEEKLNTAKDTLKRAITGLIIVVGSYAIWKFVSGYLGLQ
ncbi:hypothetical protein KAU19_07020 [Candidatus Parcubacteria bacterium]|nr:hypothetical protein [Candidatus Parcubacteria bacterium]